MSPVRPRRKRRRHIEWSPRMALSLTIGPLPGDLTLDDWQLEAAWEAYGLVLMGDAPPGTAPWGFWRFDPAVPEPLRATRPAMHLVEDNDRVTRAREDLDTRRAAWLSEHNGAFGAMNRTGGA